MASSGIHGSGIALPSASATRPFTPFQVEGMNWVGPMAPPYPPLESGQDTLVVKGFLPKPSTMLCRSGKSLVGCIPFGKMVPELMPLVSPVVRLVMTQEPTFAPMLDYCCKIARTKAGRTPVFLAAFSAYKRAV